MTFISSFLPSTCEVNVYAEQLTGAGLGFLCYRYLSAMYFNNILKYDCFVNQWRLLPEYILWVKVRSMLWQLAWQWVVDVNNQLGFLILPFLPKGVAWICPRLSPSMQWYWYYLVPRRNTLVQDLARFVSKNVWESSFYWTRLSLSNNLETKCFSVMLILLFYFCMFIRLLCVSVTLYFYYSFPCNVLCVFNSWICFYLKYYLLSFSVTPGSVCGAP